MGHRLHDTRLCPHHLPRVSSNNLLSFSLSLLFSTLLNLLSPPESSAEISLHMLISGDQMQRVVKQLLTIGVFAVYNWAPPGGQPPSIFK